GPRTSKWGARRSSAGGLVERRQVTRCRHGPAVLCLDEGAAARAERSGVCRTHEDSREGVRERSRIVGRNENAGLAVVDDLGYAVNVACHHRPLGGECLEEDERQTLPP